MDVDEALQDIEMIRTTVAGLSRKRDAVYVGLTQIYAVRGKWAKSGEAKEMRDAVALLKKCPTEQLAAFIKRNRGIEKCAEKHLAYCRKRLQANNGVKGGLE